MNTPQTPEAIEKMAIIALKKAKEVHDTLGSKGEEIINKNQFGDTALKVDILCEKAVIDVLKAYSFPITLISEEHGTITIGDTPKYFGVLDGLDGSNVYKKERGIGRYGTMFGIYNNTNPSYKDYIFGGVMLHVENQLIFATKGKGTGILENGKMRTIRCSREKKLKIDTLVAADLTYDAIYQTDILTTIMKKFTNHTILITRSFAADYTKLVEGRIDAVIGFIRKDDLEIAAAYPLIIEASGSVINIQNSSFGKLKYYDVRKEQYAFFIASGTRDLGEQIRKHLLQ